MLRLVAVTNVHLCVCALYHPFQLACFPYRKKLLLRRSFPVCVWSNQIAVSGFGLLGLARFAMVEALIRRVKISLGFDFGMYFLFFHGFSYFCFAIWMVRRLQLLFLVKCNVFFVVLRSWHYGWKWIDKRMLFTRLIRFLGWYQRGISFKFNL
ncbi:hypothetical protein CEXT_58701 [Caerostris extrusa]|uniref:Uncharacterized protein n=1 Tax=Caerostris extrusa TaxID=172846 RepID=A0AAV4MXE9_CAEEX|nr:hypothetical protein CEXT_58701 [Caerostris extrusa]